MQKLVKQSWHWPAVSLMIGVVWNRPHVELCACLPGAARLVCRRRGIALGSDWAPRPHSSAPTTARPAATVGLSVGPLPFGSTLSLCAIVCEASKSVSVVWSRTGVSTQGWRPRESGINHWRLSEMGPLGWGMQRSVSPPLMVEAGNGTVRETADHKTLMLPGFSAHSRVETTGRLNVLTRDLQDFNSHNSELESIEVVFMKRLSEVRQVPASEGLRHKVQENLVFTSQ